MTRFYRRFTIRLVCLLALGGAAGARADSEFHDLYRGERATSMGGAFTAVADDEEAIFLNPAGMAGNRGYQIQLANVDLEMSGDMILKIPADSKAFSNFSSNSLNVLMGQNVYARSQFTPSFMMPHFGIALLVDDQAALRMRNEALPQVDVGYQATNGVQAAWGFSLPKKPRNPDEFRFGIGAKLMWRRGGYRELSIPQLMNLSKDTLYDLAGSYAPGYGVDLGAQYIHTVNRFNTFQLGAAMTDVGDTHFGSYADPQKSNTKFGMAWKSNFRVFRVTVAYDYQHAFEEADWRRKQHMGFEVSLPLISIAGGLSEMYWTAGASVDVWILKVSVLSYAEDLASVWGLDVDRRYMVRISFKLGG